ncbi:MAG: type II toxin-antitoxin system RelE/ParE family toxin [Acidobacteria bacterium]|nr:type II toxin-antitoxin system RelE/ParE family toxin [Acidobacteriota bacterium]
MAEKVRTVEAYKNYFADFLAGLKRPVKDKIYWTIRLIETIPGVSEKYLKKLAGTEGLFEIRIEFGGDIFRIFCFFDDGKLIILLNGIAKKTLKTPKREIERALRLREQYYEEKS